MNECPLLLLLLFFFFPFPFPFSSRRANLLLFPFDSWKWKLLPFSLIAQETATTCMYVVTLERNRDFFNNNNNNNRRGVTNLYRKYLKRSYVCVLWFDWKCFNDFVHENTYLKKIKSIKIYNFKNTSYVPLYKLHGFFKWTRTNPQIIEFQTWEPSSEQDGFNAETLLPKS
jgi:hypothetical protein